VALNVLADDGLLVVAGHVVPLDTVVVEVVEDSHARLSALAVIGLPGAVAAGVGPVVEPAVGVGRGKLDLVGRPEPSVDVLGEELRAVAAVKVAQTSGRPEELDIVGGRDVLEVLVLVAGLEADEVHATLAAVVAGVEPVPVGAGEGGVVAPPREPVVVVAVTLDTGSVQTVLAKDSVGKAKFAGSLVGFSAAVTWEKLVATRRLRGLGTVVGEPATAAEKSAEEAAASAGRRPENVSEEIELPIDVSREGREDSETQESFAGKSHFDLDLVKVFFIAVLKQLLFGSVLGCHLAL